MYLIVSILAGFIGFGYSLILRIELSCIGVNVLFGDYQFYNVIITSHGLVMIFGFIMPVVLGGILNYWLPLINGFPDMLFPRINNLSFWLYLNGVLYLLIALLLEEGIGVGWTMYPTLICYDFHSGVSCDFLIFSVHLLGISTIINSINIVGTVLAGRRRYFVLWYLNLFVCSVLLTSFLLIICLPVLAGAVTMVLVDRNYNSAFYDVLGGGDLVLFQHLFWFFGHPEVYIIILPVFGLISHLIELNNCCFVFSVLAMVYSMYTISFLGFFVWAHHMFVVGIDLDSRSYFGCVTIFIGVPTAIKIFNWSYSFLLHDVILLFECYFIYLFIFMFLCGGVTGLFVSNAGLDILLHDTYFVVAHFHYVLSLGAVIGVFASFCHFVILWIPLELWFSSIFFLYVILFLGSNLVFLPLHSIGLYAFPRRISDYSVSFVSYTMFISLGLFFLFSFCIMLTCFFIWTVCFSNVFYIFVYCFLLLSSFYAFFVWLPISSVLYTLICDFLHLILDLCLVFLCFCFAYFIHGFLCYLIF